MNFKKMRPFIMEFLGFVVSIVLTCIVFIKYRFIEIQIHLNILTVVALIIVFCCLFFKFSRIVNLGIRSIVDLLLRKTKTCEGKFVKLFPYEASFFTKKNIKKNGETKSVCGLYYFIVIKCNNTEVTLVSPDFIELNESDHYMFKYASLSRVVLEVLRSEITVDGKHTVWKSIENN